MHEACTDLQRVQEISNKIEESNIRGKTFSEIFDRFKIEYFQADSMDEDIHGFTYFRESDSKFIIATNKNLSKEERRVALAHEIGHVILHDDYLKAHKGTPVVCYKKGDWSNVPDKVKEMEREANYFSDELLMEKKKVSAFYYKNADTVPLHVMHDLISKFFVVPLSDVKSRFKYLGLGV